MEARSHWGQEVMAWWMPDAHTLTHTHTLTSHIRLWLVRCPVVDWLLQTISALKRLPCVSLDGLWLKVMAPEREAVWWFERQSSAALRAHIPPPHTHIHPLLRTAQSCLQGPLLEPALGVNHYNWCIQQHEEEAGQGKEAGRAERF